MKRQRPTKSIHLSLILAFALAAWLSGTAANADQPMETDGQRMGERKMMMEDERPMSKDDMKERCQAMKEERQKMKAEMEAEDADLAAQVAEMNEAPDDEKLDLMASIITELVEQRNARHARRAEMQGKMMQHMMGHMRMGEGSMEDCPMMSNMGRKDGDDQKGRQMNHRQHHQNDRHQHHHHRNHRN